MARYGRRGRPRGGLSGSFPAFSWTSRASGCPRCSARRGLALLLVYADDLSESRPRARRRCCSASACSMGW
ncbi:MAG: hypothetical protein U5K43_10130 [Halofilum sp. (in: g-proteobacteria)]|nr:hypothetical protein [Halofilum sp. (in: g-proteobacteria)]